MIFKNKTTSLGLGVAVALVAGAPAMGDDTELLLVTPDPTQLPNPNVVLILDTSGSMATVEQTVAPYDPNRTYTSGACDTGALYWSETDLVPTCNSDNEQWIDKSAFYCEYATRQINGLGTFTNTLIQFRGPTGSFDTDNDAEADGSEGTLVGSSEGENASWNYLQAGVHSAPVECRSDSGQHGDGTFNEVYAAADTGVAWTSDPDQELAWGSAPRNRAYTIYDGNYLNWKSSPELVDLSRSAVMKSVATTILQSFSDMNVGVMRFNGSQGGVVLEAVKDLDANRSSLVSSIAGLPAFGSTPLSETLYENTRYWSGLSLDYPSPDDTDPDAMVPVVSGSPATERIYQQPTVGSCVKNYNILITDGEPSLDDGATDKSPLLPKWYETLSRSACTGSGDGQCLDDLSEYLSKVDLSAGSPGDQTVTTHTIGYRVDFDLLEDTAAQSGGQYFLADDVESLTTAMLRIVGEINERTVSFTPPAVSESTFNRARNLNDIYLTVFAPRNTARWPGNLKKYQIADGSIVDADGEEAVDPTTGFFFDTARSIWTTGGDDGADVTLGGAARQLPNPTSRNLYTNNGSNDDLTAASNALTPSMAGSYNASDFGLSGAEGEPSVDEIIDWMRGVDVKNEDDDESTSIRYAMGDPLHSQPAAIVYGEENDEPVVIIYTATNDGYVHAIDGASGEELWSFVPRELLPNMARLYDDPTAAFKQYGVDGDITPVIKDVNQDGVIDPDEDFVRIVMGMRRGGMNYYALDVTDPDRPELLWVRSLEDGGQSWSAPVVTRMNIDDNALNDDQAVVIVGGGYDPSHDNAPYSANADGMGAGLHILDLESGETLWRGGGSGSGADKEFDGMFRAFPTQIRVVDINGDRLADRMYAVDVSGQVWRFDVIAGETPDNIINGGRIARLGPAAQAAESSGNSNAGSDDGVSTAEGRRFYNSPDVSIFRDPISGQRYVSVALGSGYRARPFDVGAVDRFYALRDPAVFDTLTQNAYDNYDLIEVSDLVEVSGSVQTAIGASAKGWRFTLPANEKILASSLTFNNEVFFVSFDPTLVGAANCGTGQGQNFLYRVSVVNGDPIVNNLDAVVPGTENALRRTALAQGGIAPSPRVLFPSAPASETPCTGSACNPPPIMCIGVECSQLGFNNVPVRTLWTQDDIE